MNKVLRIILKLAPAMTACLTAVLVTEANSAACFVFHQPETPKALDRFSRLK